MNWGVRFLWQRYGRPIYITENGQSCNDRIFLDGRVHDPDRIDFLHRYLLALRAAEAGLAEGVNMDAAPRSSVYALSLIHI